MAAVYRAADDGAMEHPMSTTTGDFDESPRFRAFREGDPVTIIAGPFQGFDGCVVEVDRSLRTTVVEVPVFGRQTPVPCRFDELVFEGG
jgi:transcription antitermination factor NusG